MKFSLIVCTYQRPEPLKRLLKSVLEQELYPDQILIVDGSVDNATESALNNIIIPNLEYFLVSPENRGLTRQRNLGITKVANTSKVVCFLDDDIVLTPGYFKSLVRTYEDYPEAVGVGGYIINDIEWRKGILPAFNEFGYDGWVRKLGRRNELRKRIGLLSDKPPGIMPVFSNGLSIGFLPPSGKIYEVEFFMGGVSSYRKYLFEKLKFSNYFEGYGLYEDMDFCLRASQVGQLYVNTAAQLYHYHEQEGRPNQFSYGKMVIRNGWYVWRVKYPNPKLKASLKWHATAFLLTLVRFTNGLTGPGKKVAFTESLGRATGWLSLLFNKPKSYE